MWNKNIETFIGLDASFEEASCVIFGAPMDSTTSYRPDVYKRQLLEHCLIHGEILSKLKILIGQIVLHMEVCQMHLIMIMKQQVSNHQ